MSGDVEFYRADRPGGFMSCLYPCVIEFEHWDPDVADAGPGAPRRPAYYHNAEVAYQVGKPRSVAIRNWMFDAPHPSLVARAGHALYPWEIVPHWNRIKIDRMRRVLRVKFENDQLRQALLDTGTARLVESGTTPNVVNRFWGEVKGRGRNVLGVLLMEIRDAVAGRGGSLARCPRCQGDASGPFVVTEFEAAQVPICGACAAASDPRKGARR